MRYTKWCRCTRSRPFRLRQHLDRLNRSLGGIRMPAPLSHGDWAHAVPGIDFPQLGAREATFIFK